METFNVSVSGHVKHGDLWESLQKRRWSQRKAAKYLQMDEWKFGQIVGLKRVPKRLTKVQKERLLELTGKLPDELWPEFVRQREFLEAPKTIEFRLEVAPVMLAGFDLLQLPAQPDEVLEAEDLRQQIDRALAHLTSRQEEVVRLRFGLDSGEEMTLKEVGDRCRVTRGRVFQIEQKALRRLRHPRNSGRLRAALTGTEP